MMFISFDFKCGVCLDAKPMAMFVRKTEMDLQRCPDCDQLMVRLPAGSITTFKYADRNQKKRS